MRKLLKRSLVNVLIAAMACGLLSAPVKRAEAQSYVTMTAFYNDGAYGLDYLEAQAGKQVTISSREELEMFFACLKEEERTEGISFLQTEDITFSEYEFTYDEESERIGVYEDSKLIAAVSEGGIFYKTYTSSTQLSAAECGLTESYIYRSIEEPDIFYGTYDGGGYSISGLLFQSETSYTSGIFGQITSEASVSNLTVKDCLLANAYGGIVGMNEGTLSNCTADSLVGICDAVGGIAECNLGTISSCRTVHSELVAAGNGDNRLGGIVAGNYSGIIESCQTEDTILRCDGEIDAMVGGICGCQRFESLTESGIYTCTSDAKLIGGQYIGGMVGYVYSTGIMPQITNCLNIGEIYVEKDASAGGIVGGVSEDSIVSVEDCGNYGTIVYDENAVTASANIGGIAGKAAGELDAASCFNCGTICAADESNSNSTAMFCIGGLVGNSTGELWMVNSANYASVAEVHSGITESTGGIAGYLGNVSETSVINCYNIGTVSGKYAGGLIGCALAADSEELLTVAENSYNYGEINGETAGALLGKTSACICTYGYWRDGVAQNTVAGETSDSITEEAWENCNSVSIAEMTSLHTVLNGWIGEQNSIVTYSEWSQGENGYPEFVFSAWYNSLADQSEELGTAVVLTAVETEDTENTDGDETLTASGTEESQAGGTKKVTANNLAVKKFCVSVNKNCSAALCWRKNANAEYYELYRRIGGEKKYKRIAIIKGKTKYVDKKTPKGKKVFYRVRAVGSNAGKSVRGNYSKIVKAKIPWLKAPTIRVSKEKTSLGKLSVAVHLKKYEGTYSEIYVSQNGKTYVKIPLKKRNNRKIQESISTDI